MKYVFSKIFSHKCILVHILAKKIGQIFYITVKGVMDGGTLVNL